MALKATIFKVQLSISDMDRNYYGEHDLTIARHPSENNERMMLRILAFIFNANESLAFTKGLSDVDVPDLWQKNLHDEIEHWIELGQPSATRIKKGCNQAKQMIIYSYADGPFNQWWQKEENQLRLKSNLTVTTIAPELAEQLANVVDRQMHLQCTLSEGQLWLTITSQKDGEETIEVTPQTLSRN
ncbi:YaeQ family protein [Thalassotalea montiporae]